MSRIAARQPLLARTLSRANEYEVSIGLSGSVKNWLESVEANGLQVIIRTSAGTEAEARAEFAKLLSADSCDCTEPSVHRADG